MYPTRIHARPPARRGFTLVEVMISIALVLIIILGVNQVFGLTSQAVGAGQALSSITRQARSAQATMYGDLLAAETDNAPFFMIRSTTLAAFKDQQDLLADGDYQPTAGTINAIDTAIRSVERDGLPPGATKDNYFTPRALLTDRTHRVDQLSFFVRSNARRQTGDRNTFYSNVGTRSAYITYTHLRQPNNAGPDANGNDLEANQIDPGFLRVEPEKSVTDPGQRFGIRNQAQNPNNFFARQWVLGRKVLFMRDPDEQGINKVILDQTTGEPVSYFARQPNEHKNVTSPLAPNSLATNNGQTFPAGQILQSSYFDLVGTSLETYASLMSTTFLGSTPTTPGESRWHDHLAFRPAGFASPTRPLSPAGAARTVPVFMTGCTQFCVEFAGDFLTQTRFSDVEDEIGKITGANPDGVIDFIYEKQTGAGYSAGQGKRTIRWYGFPRDTDGDGRILTPEWAKKNSRNAHQLRDTLPLRDYARIVAGPGHPGYKNIERDMDEGTNLRFPDNTPDDYAVDGVLSFRHEYKAVWSADTIQDGMPLPKMVRITIGLDDPLGRLGADQYFEYIIDVP